LESFYGPGYNSNPANEFVGYIGQSRL